MEEGSGRSFLAFLLECLDVKCIPHPHPRLIMSALLVERRKGLTWWAVRLVICRHLGSEKGSRWERTAVLCKIEHCMQRQKLKWSELWSSF